MSDHPEPRELRRFFKQCEGLDSNIVLAFYMNALVGAVNRAADVHATVTAAQSRNIGKCLGLISTAITLQVPADDPRVVEFTAIIQTAMDQLETATEEVKQ